jgi:hypothetical protein
VLETDSAEVASKISKESQDRSSYGPLVSEIKALLMNFDEFLVRAVWQTANKAVHGLAKLGCNKYLFHVWNRVIPEGIVTKVKLTCLLLNIFATIDLKKHERLVEAALWYFSPDQPNIATQLQLLGLSNEPCILD